MFNGLQTIVKINGKMACHKDGNMADCFHRKRVSFDQQTKKMRKFIHTESSFESLAKAQGCKITGQDTYTMPDGQTRFYEYCGHRKTGIDAVEFMICVADRAITAEDKTACVEDYNKQALKAAQALGLA